jgi:hypothetical protein
MNIGILYDNRGGETPAQMIASAVAAHVRRIGKQPTCICVPAGKYAEWEQVAPPELHVQSAPAIAAGTIFIGIEK